ncbi:MAG: molybdate ABC transporter permease subunit [Cyanobacteria bacterium P01_D01_bin.1]
MVDISPLWISLRIAAIATTITAVLGISAAYFMQGYQGKWRSLLESLFLAPLVLPPTVLGFLLLLLFGQNGPLGTLLTHTGISVVFTWYAAIITATVVSFPLMYKTALGAFEQIDSSLQQAARTLGASERTVFLRITLPLALPGLFAGLTLAFSRALGEFGATLMLAGNIPGRTQTLPMAIYFAVESGNFGDAALWSAVVLCITLGGIVLVNGTTSRKRYQSSVFKEVYNNLFSRLTMHSRGSERSRDSDRSERYRKILGNSSGKKQSLLASPSQFEPRLEVSIRKRLSDYTLAIDFVADGQQPIGVLGASGAGKSLMLRCIAGVETPDAGRIVLNDRVLFDSDQGIDLPSCDRKISILFQNYALFPHLTIAQNIAFGLPAKLSTAQMRSAVGQQLAAVQLESFSQRYPHELSGGQQQRVALARALASEPEAFLLDEPFSALDTHLRGQIERQMFARLRSYHGFILLVTHNLEEAYRVCDQLLVLDDGNILAYRSKHSVFGQPRTVRIAQLTGCKNFSPAVPIGEKRVEAQHWQCSLDVESIPPNLRQVGIHAHQIIFLQAEAAVSSSPTVSSLAASSLPNTFQCWLAATSETPHRMTLYLKLHQSSSSERDYHLQAEVSKEQWHWLKAQPLPWQVHLDPKYLLPLTD